MLYAVYSTNQKQCKHNFFTNIPYTLHGESIFSFTPALLNLSLCFTGRTFELAKSRTGTNLKL